jgi:large subunit ribosomal protein L32e
MTKKPKFLRRNWSKKSRLGNKRKKKQVWRSPHGRHSKTRKKRKGYPAIVQIGYRKDKRERELIKNSKPVIVQNIKELEKMKKGEIAIIGKVGNKKRIEIAKKAKEKGIQIHNINVNKILKKVKKTETKTVKEEKKK